MKLFLIQMNIRDGDITYSENYFLHAKSEEEACAKTEAIEKVYHGEGSYSLNDEWYHPRGYPAYTMHVVREITSLEEAVQEIGTLDNFEVSVS